MWVRGLKRGLKYRACGISVLVKWGLRFSGFGALDFGVQDIGLQV